MKLVSGVNGQNRTKSEPRSVFVSATVVKVE